MIGDQGICQIAAPKFAVFAVQPKNSAVTPPVFLANVGIGIVSLLWLSSESPTLSPVELILVLFVVRKGEFLDDDLGMKQT